MKTLIFALAISFAPIFGSVVEVQSTKGNDQSGLCPQIDRILSDKAWPTGEVELTFELDDMNLIHVREAESSNQELAENVSNYLQEKEVFPRLSSEQEIYIFTVSFEKKQRIIFRGK